MPRIALFAGLAAALALSTPVGAAAFPDRIALPNAFGPEGIAVGRGHTFFVGSVAGGGIFRGDLRTGEGDVFVPGAGRAFVGLKVDRFDRLWVSGGPAGTGYVFDADSGDLLATLPLTAARPTFINDVVVTREAAWFTDSQQPAVYRVPIAPNGEIGEPETISLAGLIDFVPGAFNLNGIDATPNGKTLLTIISTTGTLYAIDAATLEVTPVAVAGGPLTNGDGILLEGRTLYVVRNFLNQVAVVELEPQLASGTVVDVLTDPSFAVPTTIARFGDSLYLPNARFGIPPGPLVEYTVTRLDR